MRGKKVAAVLLAVMAGGTPCVGYAAEDSAFVEVMEHYEAVRLALVGDSMDGVGQHAEAIERRMRELLKNFDAAKAGVPADKAAECRALLPEVASAAGQLAEAEGFDAAREAFYEISKMLVRYRELAGIEGSVVVACSMAKKAWIQPAGDIGNPYMGAAMPTCGEVVPE